MASPPFTFLAPLWLLAGVIACALPIVAHFFSLRRPRTIYFPAARLIQRSRASSARRTRLHDIALLMVRIGAILLIATAFAQPSLIPSDVNTEHANPPEGIDLIVILDASASMQRAEASDEHMAPSASCFDAARLRAAGLLAKLDPGRDRAAVILMASRPTAILPALTANLPALRQGLRESHATLETAVTAPAIQLAQSLFDRPSSPRARRIIVLSDFQDSSWRSAQVPTDCDVELQRMAPSTPEGGAAVVSLELAGSRAAVGAPARLIARVANHSSSPRTLPLTLTVGDIADNPVTFTTIANLPGSAESAHSFGLTFERAGLIPVSISIRADGFPHDDIHRAIIDVAAAPNAVIVSGDRSVSDFSRPAAWLHAALSARSEAPDAIVPMASDAVTPASIAPFDEIVVTPEQAIPDSAIAALADHAMRGASILWIMGTEADARSLARLEERIVPRAPNVPLRSMSQSDSASGFTVTSLIADHPALTALGPRACEALREFSFSRPPPILAFAGARSIASYNDASPFLSEVSVGAGKLFILRADLTPSRCELLRSPMFPALLVELFASARALVPPLRAPLSISREYPVPGFVLVAREQRAVNLDPAESDLAFLDPAQIARSTAMGAEASAGVRASSTGDPFSLWPACLLMALALLAIESALLSRSEA